MAEREEPVAGPVYVTRYGLTRGIAVYNGGRIVKFDSGNEYFQHGNPSFSCSDPTYCFVGKNDYTTDREVALARVQAKAEKKLKSLAKQQKKLNAIANGEGIKFVEVSDDE